MGLLKFSEFSSTPNLFKRLAQRQQQREATRTQIGSDFIQFVLNNGTRILADGSSAGVAANIYAVPEGKVFYLTSVFMSSRNGTATAKIISLNVAGVAYMVNNLSPSQASTVASSSNPSVPTKFTSGEAFVLNGVSDSRTSVTIVGYELDEKGETERL